MRVDAPISLGELVDKITILEIKQANIADASKLNNVEHELEVLNNRLRAQLDVAGTAKLSPLKARLKTINETLWRIEDDIRDCERNRDFGDEFIRLARAVYFTNDDRANEKKNINTAFGSELVEEKSYQSYQ